MTTVPDRTTFETTYAGQPTWDIGKRQKSFIAVADKITGRILDAGCGTGDTAGGPKAWFVVVRSQVP